MTNPTSGFWADLPRPFFILAPMSGVTDPAFRKIIATYGKPEVMMTEFVSTEGLCSAGREHLIFDLDYCEEERPIVAQIFGRKPDLFKKTAELLGELKFDGIDINMGCPDRNVIKQGAGAALINDPTLAAEIVRATREGAGRLPVSIKTRTGYDRPIVESWIPKLLEMEPDAIILHGRTKKEMSLVPADWNQIARAAEIIHKSKSTALIVGNGDVVDPDDGRLKAEKYALDGIMIGRGIFGRPWLFDPKKLKPDIPARLLILIEHVEMFERCHAERKSFSMMKKHFKSYLNGFNGARELRSALMEADNASEVISRLRARLASFSSNRVLK